MISKILGITSLLLCLGITACTPRTSSNQMPLEERKVLESIERETIGQNNGPIVLEHRKLSLQEIGNHLRMDEEHTKAHLAATNIHGYYSLQAKNYPPDTEFILYQVDLSRNVRPLKTFTVTPRGSLATRLDNLFVDIENNFVFFSNYLPGEPADFVLGSEDRRYYAATRIIPNPILVEDSGQRMISAQIDAADRRHYLIYCKGLQPFREYHLMIRFENEQFDHILQANREGELFMKESPKIAWIQGGDAIVELRGEDLPKPLVLRFHWGF